MIASIPIVVLPRSRLKNGGMVMDKNGLETSTKVVGWGTLDLISAHSAASLKPRAGVDGAPRNRTQEKHGWRN